MTSEETDKGLISKIYKQLIQLNTKKTNKQTKKPNQKVGKRPKQTFLKEDMQRAKKHRKDAQHCSLLGK